MAFLRKRASGVFAVVFKWKGKQYIKSLGTKDRGEAEQIKKDAEDQLDRIRNGRSALASKLLADAVELVLKVLFGWALWRSQLSPGGQEVGGSNPLAPMR